MSSKSTKQASFSFIKGVDSPSAISASLRSKSYLKVNSNPNPKKAPDSDDDDSTASKTEKRVGYEFDVAVIDRGDDGGKYGWFGYTPPWLQWMCNRRCLLASLSLIAFAQGFFANGILSSNVQPVHRRFGLKMMDIGFIRMMYDLGMTVALIPVMYFNLRGTNRPQWLGISCLVMASGAAIYAIPQFIMGEYRPPKIDVHSCNYTATTTPSFADNEAAVFEAIPKAVFGDLDVCDEPPEDLRWYKYIFMLGVFLNGVGAAPYFTMGIAFMDEYVSHRQSMIYTGVLNAFLLFGVACGFWFNSVIAFQYFIDVDKGITHDSSLVGVAGWIWAWWLGAIVTMFLSLVASVPISGFPNVLPGASKAHIQDAVDRGDEDEKDVGPHSMIQSAKACLTNVTYVGLIMEQCSYLALVTGFASFIVIFVRAVYGNAYWKARFAGGLVALCAMVGSATGTLIQHQFYLNTKAILRFSLITAVATLPFISVAFIPCTNMSFAGRTKNYPVDTELNIVDKNLTLNATCNSHCGNCTDDDFSPVCWENKIGDDPKLFLTFYSTCHAGCTSNGTHAWDCMCVPKNDRIGGPGGGDLTYLTRCISKACTYRGYAFMIGFCWAAVLIFVRINPMQQCLLRCISYKDRVVGLTMSAILSRVVGAMPGPVGMGLLTDLACTHWGTVCGKEEAFCAWREEWPLTYGAAGLGLGLGLVGIAGLAVANYGFKEKSQ